jgi:hypothetical protein
VNRLVIWNCLFDGESAEHFMADLLALGFQHCKQYGIVTLKGEPVTHSGNNVGHARYGVARTIEGISYAIQGNVLAGIQVITDAENAFLVTAGDLGQKVMAAMEAARSYGGDGRCSCDPIHPTSCGCPPPPFVLADQTAFFLLARQGDTDGDCDAQAGCGTGSYFANLNRIGFPNGRDPVFDLQDEYTLWRSSLAGRADQLRSRVTAGAASLPADGTSETTVEVELRDIDDQPVLADGVSLSIVRAYDGPPVAKFGAVETLGPGRFRFPVRAGRHAGEGRWRISVHHPDGSVLLWPELVIPIVPPQGSGSPGVVR